MVRIVIMFVLQEQMIVFKLITASFGNAILIMHHAQTQEMIMHAVSQKM